MYFFFFFFFGGGGGGGRGNVRKIKFVERSEGTISAKLRERSGKSCSDRMGV